MPSLSEIDVVGVVGAGTMGNGIAQVAATAGYDVVMRDVEREYVDRGLDSVADSLDRLAGKDALDEEPDAIRDRITGTTDLDDLAAADVAIEAVVEDLDVKRDVFGDLDRVTDDDAVLATNTSTLSITTIASAPTPRSSTSRTPSPRTSARRPGRPTTSPASSPTAS
jgi:3-hydroxybutyryl-CoA dehydrogenase